MNDFVRPRMKVTEEFTSELPGITPLSIQERVPASIVPKLHREHPFKKLLFLVPALILVFTLAGVAFVLDRFLLPKEQQVAIVPTPIETTPTPSPTPKPLEPTSYINGPISFAYMPQFDLLECKREQLDIILFLVSDIQTSEEPSLCEDPVSSQVSFVSGDLVTELEGEVVSSEDFEIDKISALKETTQVGETKRVYVSFEFEEISYQIVLWNFEKLSEFEALLGSISLKEVDPTKDWSVFENTTYNYKIKYPPQWELVSELVRDGFSPLATIRKSAQGEIHKLTIEVSSNVGNAQLTASSIISSTRTLTGWADPPMIELAFLGGGNAEVISGVLSGRPTSFVVIWYKNGVVQMTWEDDVALSEKETFENMLSTFRFLN